MTTAELQQLADLIADRLIERQLDRTVNPELVDARTLAAQLDVTAEWVRDHADDLGAIRIGTGPRPRLRFDPTEARARLPEARTPRPHAPQRPVDPAPQPAARPRRRTQPAAGVELLPINRSTT